MISLALARSKIVTKAHHHSILLMGCHFVITSVHQNPNIAWGGIRAAVTEISRIESLISSWSEDSETHEININAGIRPVRVNAELFNLIERSIKVSKLTSGAFDISGTLSRDYWAFDGSHHKMLAQEKIIQLRQLIDFRKIVLDLDHQTIFLKDKGMKIGFGGIAKGYAAYRAQEVMKTIGVDSGLINASGDLVFWGNPPGKQRWEINIPDPRNRESSILNIGLPFGSVVTSGSYENFTIIDGKRYSHIVDPRTALPVTNLKSVSVISPNPELADALATAVSVMGAKDGFALINKLKGIECIAIDEEDKLHFSHNLQTEYL